MQTKKIVLISATVFLLLVFAVYAIDKYTKKTSLSDAPLFTLKLFDGKELTLKEFRGKPVVLNFWASWCGPCRFEAPTLEKVYRIYKEKGVIFIGINIADSEANARAFIQEFDITFLNGYDRDGKIARDYEVTSIPTTFFITKDGKIALRYTGAISESELTGAIEELLK